MQVTERLVEVSLDSGELVYVQPLSVWGQQAILNLIDDEHPAPAPEDYQKPLEGSVIGASYPLEMNTEYQAALTANRAIRNRLFTARVFEAGVVVDTPEGRAATLARYASRLAQRRAVMRLPEDDWTALVMFILVTSTNDISLILNAATANLREDEVRSALRAFRRPVQR